MLHPVFALLLACPFQEPLGPPVQVKPPAPLHDLHAGEQLVGTWDLSGRVPALWPVTAPGGAVVTRGYPMVKVEGESEDHPHHQGFWTAHGDVNGADFWHDKETRIHHVGEVKRGRQGPRESLAADFEWLGPNGVVHLKERRELRAEDRGELRFIDRLHRFQVPGSKAAVFGDTKEGMFAIRLCRELRPDKGAELRNSEGQTNGEAWGKAARWIAYEGQVQGQWIGVALFDHPQNLRHPVRWHARTYGLAAANPFGLHHFTGAPKGEGAYRLEPGESLELRYRTVIYRGRRTAAQLQELWQAWSRDPVSGGD